MATATSAADLVAAGVQECADDACSICLEPFSHEEPATLTACQHSFHLQCVLEWAQRRPAIECPMCWQPLALQDPTAAALLAGVEQEAALLRPASAPTARHHFPHVLPFQLPSDRSSQQRLLDQLALAVTRTPRAPPPAVHSGEAAPALARNRVTGEASSSSPPPLSTFAPTAGVSPPVRPTPGLALRARSSPQREGPSESLKARLVAATRGYKDTAAPKITKGFRWLLSAFSSPEGGSSEAGPSSAPSSSSGFLRPPHRPVARMLEPALRQQGAFEGGPSASTASLPPPRPPEEGRSPSAGPSSETAGAAAPPRQGGHRRTPSNLTRELQKMTLNLGPQPPGDTHALAAAEESNPG